MKEGINVVYKIINKNNKRFYIGSTNDPHRRFIAHFRNHTCTINQHNELHEDMKFLDEDDFLIEILFETEDIIEASRLESKMIRENKTNPLMYNKVMGASGRRVFYKTDIVFIRQLYASKTMHVDEVYNSYYKDIVTHRAFKKVWHGETFKDVHYQVYTDENKKWHFAKGQSRPGQQNGRAILSEYDVLNIRKQRDEGCNILSVFKRYKDTGISYAGFKSIWDNKTWKYLI